MGIAFFIPGFLYRLSLQRTPETPFFFSGPSVAVLVWVAYGTFQLATGFFAARNTGAPFRIDFALVPPWEIKFIRRSLAAGPSICPLWLEVSVGKNENAAML
jgi:hypothetical protein